MGLPADLIPLPTMPYSERPDALPLNVEECRTALWRCRGNVTEAAALLKITPNRLRKFVKASPYLSGEAEEARENLKDLAEDVVYEALNDTEDTSRRDTMARYVLTNLAGDRGYGSGKQVGVNVNLPKGKMTITWGDGSEINDNAAAEPEAKVIEHE